MPDLQREVQRLLGRCLLRLQQYERLLKALVAHHDACRPDALSGRASGCPHVDADRKLSRFLV